MNSEPKEGYTRIVLPSYKEALEDSSKFWQLPPKRQGRVINFAKEEGRLNELPVEEIFALEDSKGIKLKLATSFASSSNPNEKAFGLKLMDEDEELQKLQVDKVRGDYAKLISLYLQLENPSEYVARKTAVAANDATADFRNHVNLISLKPYCSVFFPHVLKTNTLTVEALKLYLMDARKLLKEDKGFIAARNVHVTQALEMVFCTDDFDVADVLLFMHILSLRDLKENAYPIWLYLSNMTERNKRIARLAGMEKRPAGFRVMASSLKSDNLKNLGLFKDCSYQTPVEIHNRRDENSVEIDAANRREYYEGSGFHELDSTYAPHVNLVEVALHMFYRDGIDYNQFDEKWWDFVLRSKTISNIIWTDNGFISSRNSKQSFLRDFDNLMMTLHAAPTAYVESFFEKTMRTKPHDKFVKLVTECCNGEYCTVKRSLARIPLDKFSRSKWQDLRAYLERFTETIEADEQYEIVDPKFYLKSTDRLVSMLSRIDNSKRMLTSERAQFRAKLVNELKMRGVKTV